MKVWRHSFKEHHNRVRKIHEAANQSHKSHNERVAAFHKNHIAEIERGENGTGWLAEWERFFYGKAKSILSKVQ